MCSATGSGLREREREPDCHSYMFPNLGGPGRGPRPAPAGSRSCCYYLLLPALTAAMAGIVATEQASVWMSYSANFSVTDLALISHNIESDFYMFWLRWHLNGGFMFLDRMKILNHFFYSFKIIFQLKFCAPKVANKPQMNI